MSALDKAVTKSKREDGTDGWDFRCPGVQGDKCGGDDGPFASTGWPTKAAALARGEEHFAAHKFGLTDGAEGHPQSSLEEFRAKHKLGVDAGGNAVRLEDL